jgi:hypothetical protein
MPGQILIILPFMAIFLFPIIVAKIEKRKTWPYSEQYDFGDFQLSPYNQSFLDQCISSAQTEGFIYLEKGYDGKGKRYKVVYEFLISGDLNTLALIGAGSVMNMPVNGMWLFSKDAQGNCFTTVTSQNAVEYDLTGYWKSSLIITNDFRKAFHHHLHCVAKSLYYAEPYTENGEIDDFRRMIESKIDYLNEGGWIKYVGENTDYWKYTVKGAIKLATCQIIFGIMHLPGSVIKGLLKTKNN